MIENKTVKLTQLETIIKDVTNLSRGSYKLSQVHRDGSVTVRFRNGRFEAAQVFFDFLVTRNMPCEHVSTFNVKLNIETL